jgi:hypothetical protein
MADPHKNMKLTRGKMSTVEQGPTGPGMTAKLRKSQAGHEFADPPKEAKDPHAGMSFRPVNQNRGKIPGLN